MFRAPLCALIAMVGALLIPTMAMAQAPVAGHLRYAIDRAAVSASYTGTAGRNRYVILQSGENARLASLKAADPNVKVLMYKDLSAMVERDQWGGVSTGVATQDAAANPDWYLLNKSGQRFTFNNYGWMWAADIGNAAYQKKWADNVIAELQAEGWDGVFMDDTNPTIRYHYAVDQVAKYPSDTAYGAATRSAVASIGPRVRAAGKLIIPNMGAWRDYPTVIADWLQFVDGGMDELFTKWGRTAGEGYLYTSAWDTQLEQVKTAERMGKAFLAVTQSANDDPMAMRYGWATLLLAANGRSTFALHGDYTNENWFPEYDLPIGSPLGAETKDVSGVHRRLFSNGIVLVNPTLSTLSVSLGGRYSGCGLTDVSSVTMGPHTGLVLASAATPSPSPAPAPTATPTPTPTATPAPAPTAAPTPTPTATPAPAPTATPTPTPAPTRPGKPAKPPRPKSTSRKLASTSGSVVRGKSVRVAVTCRSGATCRQRIVLRAGRRTVASRRVVVAAGCSRAVRVKLHASGRRALRRHGRLRVRVVRIAHRPSAARITPRRVIMSAV